MRTFERAAQIWPVLAFAASNRQTITYPTLARLIGVHQAGLGQLLEPIQSYCLVRALPPLTILVVKSKSGMPGTGFVAAADIPKHQQEVFNFSWLRHTAPSPEKLEIAVRQRPSNGIS